MSKEPDLAWALRAKGSKVSIVVPAYNEEGSLERLLEEIRSALPEDFTYECIFVDDGSEDDTWATICTLNKKDAHVKGVRLSRNFGHQYALLAGLTHSRGDAVITMDADLQHPPSVIPTLLNKWKDGAQIVHTIRIDSGKESFLKRITSRVFYKLFTFLSGVKIEAGMADFRLLDRYVVDRLLEFREEGLFLRGLVQWVGFPSARVEFQCAERFQGTSSYTLQRMLKLAWNGVTSFSLVPLRIGILIGLATSLLAFIELGYAVTVKLFGGSAVPGWASGVSIISLLFGILFIFLGLVGEYIGRILIEVRARPRFIASSKVGFDEESAARPSTTGEH